MMARDNLVAVSEWADDKGVGLVKLGLETWVFPLATEGQYGYYGRVPPEPYFLNKSVDSAAVTTGTVALSPADQQVFEQWKQDYQTWREEEKNKDWTAIERQRRFVDNFALLLGGLALLFSHGYIIRRDKKQQP